MKQKTSQTLYSYWNEVRAARVAPRRFEIEPGRIAAILPETFVLERSAENAYRYRLAGTRICEQFGGEFRGADFLAGWNKEDQLTLQHLLSVIARQGGVGVLCIEATGPSKRFAGFEILILPLVHTRQTVDRFMGSITALAPPDWLGSEPLGEKRILAHDLVWPDGRPHAVIEKLHGQAPFLPTVRNARVVRFKRRQFRVYDGGLSKSGAEDV